jgi:hypothetical protein
MCTLYPGKSKGYVPALDCYAVDYSLMEHCVWRFKEHDCFGFSIENEIQFHYIVTIPWIIEFLGEYGVLW